MKQMKIAYTSHGNFNLRDLVCAPNNLPTDAFSLESNAPCKDLTLADVLSEKIVFVWEGHDKNVARKVIPESCCFVDALDSVKIKDEAGNCVLVECVWLEQTSSDLGDIMESVNNFVKQITGSRKNCSFPCFSDGEVLYDLTNRWFPGLKDDREEPLRVHFVFKTNSTSTLNHISCNLHTSFNPVVDEFNCCQVEVRDCNPFRHERCFPKLSLLVKETQFGAIPSESNEGVWGSDLDLQDSETCKSAFFFFNDKFKQTTLKCLVICIFY